MVFLSDSPQLTQLQTNLDVLPIQYCSGIDPYTYVAMQLTNHLIIAFVPST